MRFTYPALFHLISKRPDKGGYFIQFPDLPCCATQTHNPEDAMEYAVDVLSGWIGVGFECGHALNHPSDPSAFHIDDGFVELVTSDDIDGEAAIAEGMARAAQETRKAV